MARSHARTLGPKIAKDLRLLNYLRGRSVATVDQVDPGSTRIEVEGGTIASSCAEDHEEVLGCWAFYRQRGKPN
jgi:hypothetical protein